MIIRAVLIIFILAIVLWFMIQNTSTKRQAWGKLVVFILLILGVLAVLFPGSTNVVAHKVGVGRGADLLLYILAIMFVASLLFQYLRRQDDQSKVERLARKLAIFQATQDSHNVEILKKYK